MLFWGHFFILGVIRVLSKVLKVQTGGKRCKVQFGAYLNIHSACGSCLSLVYITRGGVPVKWKVYM
jgi:hypothetical protein